MPGETDAPSSTERGATVSETLRPLLEELEEYLAPLPDDQLSELVLPLGSAWVLEDAGFDLERYDAEAKEFVAATPEHDRILRSFPNSVAYYMGLRLTMSRDDEPEPERAQAQLDAAR